MSDRIGLLTVSLDQDIRDDDAEKLKAAIMQMRGVISVTGMVSDLNTHLAEERARREWLDRLLAAADRRPTPQVRSRLC